MFIVGENRAWHVFACGSFPHGRLRGVLLVEVRLVRLDMTIFSRILAGEIPCHQVYRDAQVLAFLDVGPLSRGHTLVIPTEARATLAELSDESAAAIGRVLPRLCRAVMKATGCGAYNILQNNGTMAHQVVQHVHFHIIPKYPGGEGLEIGWPAGRLDPAAGAELARAITAAMGPATG